MTSCNLLVSYDGRREFTSLYSQLAGDTSALFRFTIKCCAPWDFHGAGTKWVQPSQLAVVVHAFTTPNSCNTCPATATSHSRHRNGVIGLLHEFVA